MPKKEEVNLKESFLKNIPWLAGIFVAILNLWIVAKLAPISESISGLNIRVSAVEKRMEMYDSTLSKIDDKFTNILTEIGNLKQYCH